MKFLCKEFEKRREIIPCVHQTSEKFEKCDHDKKIYK